MEEKRRDEMRKDMKWGQDHKDEIMWDWRDETWKKKKWDQKDKLWQNKQRQERKTIEKLQDERIRDETKAHNVIYIDI